MILHDYQIKMIQDMAKFKGRGTLQVTGRQSGKSMVLAAITQAMQQLKSTQKEKYTLRVEQGDGRVFGARYHTVHPIIEPVWNAEPQIWNEMMQWMLDTFGPSPSDGIWTPGARWYANNAKFWFREEKDLTLFLLRWQ